ncbi:MULTISPECIES: hypothetical protein [Streptomyces]|uniref:Uncharacterized protein n=1 Tax=Streptomyces xanthii TaxID=2768069 RepID=A0A7H1B1Y1_9ACTN|nr:hypothetical protein [Streptomyces xanthii]QNS02736.1 hypothetical protein IAG42_03250 [Streptomyces xanthii]
MVDPGDKEFYHRSPHAWMPEDRPRGGGPTRPVKHRGTLATVLLIAAVILVILVGIALFP